MRFRDLSECKICEQSWDPPRDIIYKNGMCIVCYHRNVDWLNEKEKVGPKQQNLEAFL